MLFSSDIGVAVSSCELKRGSAPERPVEVPYGTKMAENGTSNAEGIDTPKEGNPNMKTRHNVVFVDDDLEEIERGIGFSPNIFIKNEFKTLKKFCNSRKVHQRHLNFLFAKYLSADDIYLREFRVKALDVKDRFDGKEKIMKEIAEIFIPSMYQKPFKGLEKAHSLYEVSFARFIILTYILCAEPIPDLILNLFAILRQRFNLQPSATIFTYNVEQMVSVFHDALKPTDTSRYLLHMLADLPKERELPISDVIRMGIKYPLMFYALKAFRVHMRRLFGGDNFWAEPVFDPKTKTTEYKVRKNLKSKLAGPLELEKGHEMHFENQEAATRATAKSILEDIMDAPQGGLQLNPEKPSMNLTEIDDRVANQVKLSIGYHLAKKIILESQLPLVVDFEKQAFLDERNIEKGEFDTRHTDELSGQDLTYNMSTGRRSWVLKFMNYEEGKEDEVLREVEIDHEPKYRDDLDEDDDDDTYYDDH